MAKVGSLGLVLAGALAGVTLVVACADFVPESPLDAGSSAKADDLSDAGVAPGATKACTQWKVRALPVFISNFGGVEGTGTIRDLVTPLTIDAGWEPMGTIDNAGGQTGAAYTVLLRSCVR